MSDATPRILRPTQRLLAVSGSGLLLGAALSGVAHADAPAAAAGSAFLRLADLSPQTAIGQVSVTPTGGTAQPLLTGVHSGAFSPYLRLAPGSYAVTAGFSSDTGEAFPDLSWSVTLGPGEAATATALGSGSVVRATVLKDDMTPAASGHAEVRVIQAASGAATANVVAAGQIQVAQDAAFATATPYVQVPAGTWPLTAQGVASPGQQTTANISLPSGSVTSVVLLDAPNGGLQLTSALDTAGTGAMPRSGVKTGAGGTATTFVTRAAAARLPRWSLPAGVVALLALTTAGVGWRRTDRRAV